MVTNLKMLAKKLLAVRSKALRKKTKKRKKRKAIAKLFALQANATTKHQKYKLKELYCRHWSNI